ncbi:hypothetical protein [Acidipila sp. EB88]|uniref:hypothetical protein n=1 Tax=Acidipila sp. EB88 TaxID=2305226 RepID=UPI000FA9B0F7|nr:hypothetical protein [Acidipila sp. EB88]RRA47628.1 hypothetical protein D1Y84_04295 [Acidipila sp. EB88]
MSRQPADTAEYALPATSRAGLAGLTRWEHWRHTSALLATVVLAACAMAASWSSRHWPLVNDAALMHYVVLLMQAGMTPYRDIGDINLPGAYVPEWISTLLARTLGLCLASVWRLMDLAAVVLAGLAMLRIAGRSRWFAGVFAGTLFALYHGRDGIGQAGQRDLWLTMLLLWAVAVLHSAWPETHNRTTGRWQGKIFGFGLLVGAATMIKPFEAMFLVCLLPWLARAAGGPAGGTALFRGRALGMAAAGFSLPLLLAGCFLAHWGALGALAFVLRVDLPYHVLLARVPFWQLLRASSIASVAKLELLLVACWVACRIAGRVQLSGILSGSRPGDLHRRPGFPKPGSSRDRACERTLLLAVLLGLVSFVAQGKGFPYQRYPFVAFLLLYSGLQFTAAVRSNRQLPRALGVAGFGFGVLLMAPSYLRAVEKAQWSTPTIAAMEQALLREAGPQGVRALDGEVQCLDLITGCTDALLHLGAREATGTVYDEFLFPQALAGSRGETLPPPGDLPAAVLHGQQQFREALEAHPPRDLIITEWLFPQGPGRYRKLELWPWFHAYLAAHYRLAEQHDFVRAENGPMGFRLYVRRDETFR